MIKETRETNDTNTRARYKEVRGRDKMGDKYEQHLIFNRK